MLVGYIPALSVERSYSKRWVISRGIGILVHLRALHDIRAHRELLSKRLVSIALGLRRWSRSNYRFEGAVQSNIEWKRLWLPMEAWKFFTWIIVWLESDFHQLFGRIINFINFIHFHFIFPISISRKSKEVCIFPW